MLDGKRVLLVVAGGIAAYKCLELIRRLGERGASVRCVLTEAGARFVTPLSLAAISGNRVHGDLFAATDDGELGHIRLARTADLVVVAPATADLIARMATGLANDLASTVLLATRAPILVAPAMNPAMWAHPATRTNWAVLEARGVMRVGPAEGEMAEPGERGPGRMAEAGEILAAIEAHFAPRRLGGRRALVTSGPTFEAIDPVRYIANRSSGRQGHAVAAALAGLGAETTLVAGPTAQPDPAGVRVVRVESAREMLAACQDALPVDVAVCVAAVADWRVAEAAAAKIKKGASKAPPALKLVENPDILATLAAANRNRPRLVVGFAAETEAVVENAVAKLGEKGCDWIVANDVGPGTGAFGGEENAVHLVIAGADGPRIEAWPAMAKRLIAERLATRIADALDGAGVAGTGP